jgi:hypothetical protein
MSDDGNHRWLLAGVRADFFIKVLPSRKTSAVSPAQVGATEPSAIQAESILARQ